MSETHGKPRVPDLLVEKLAAGDLSEREANAVRARLEQEEGGLARLEALRRSDEEVLAAYPPARMARDIEDRLRVQAASERRPSRGSAWWIGLPAAAAAAALLLVVVAPGGPTGGSGERGETILTKGVEPRLRVYMHEPGGARPLEQGDRARAGDVIQLAYVAGGAAYGVIVSVDGRGAITLHLPRATGDAVRLERGGVARLDGAFKLDDAPAFERFFLVTAEAPFPTRIVEDAARRLAAGGDPRAASLRLPDGYGQVSFLVQKDEGGAER